MAESRIAPGTEVEWQTVGQGTRRLRGRVLAFIPAGESAWAMLPEEERQRAKAGKERFNDRSAFDRYLILVEAEAKPKELWRKTEAGWIRYLDWPPLRPLRKPRYAAPVAGVLEKQVLARDDPS